MESAAGGIFDFDFSQRVLLDTNIVLNACFHSKGIARVCVQELVRRGCSIFLPEWGHREAHKTISKVLGREYKYNEVERELADFGRNIRALTLPIEKAFSKVEGVSRADQQISITASRNNLTLITDDIDLVWGHRKAGGVAVQPYQVARERLNAVHGLGGVFKINPVFKNGLSVFVRIRDTGWIGKDSKPKGDLARFHNHGIFVDRKIDRVVGFWADTKVFAGRLPNEGENCAALFQVSQHAEGMRLKLFVRIGGDKVDSASATTKPAPINITPDELYQNFSHGYGCLQDIVASGKIVKPKSAKNYLNLEDTSPNPYDANELEAAIRFGRRFL